MGNLWKRMVRAALLDVRLYEEVEHDPAATQQSVLVVVLSSLASGIGSLQYGILGLLGIALGALVGWFIWAAIVYLIGAKLLPQETTEADLGQLLRTIGFSASPGVIRVLGIIPGLGGIINFIAAIWMLVAMVVAVRQALDYSSTARAVLVCIVGWFVYLLLAIVLGISAL